MKNKALPPRCPDCPVPMLNGTPVSRTGQLFFYCSELSLSSKIFIDMKRNKTTLILTYTQANSLLNNLPAGHQVKVSIKDLNKIIDRAKKAHK